MTVNEELREIAIKRFLDEYEERARRNINDNLKKAAMAMVIIYGIVFAVIALKYYFSGRFEEGAESFGIGMMVSLAFLLPACLLVWIMLRVRASRDRDRTEEELRKTTYSIEGDSLIKRVKGDGRRTKGYKIEQISNVSKDGHIVTFDYGNAEVELLDFYEPSLFDSLKDGTRE